MKIKPQRKSISVESLRPLLGGSIIAALIVISPYFFYIYESFPDVNVWEFSFFGSSLKFESHYWGSIQVLGWVLFAKLIPLVFLIIWFFTCKHWWYHALLIPICMFIFQIYMTLNEDLIFADSNEFYVLAPLILVALVFLYGIRTKIFDRLFGIDYDELKRVSLKGEINKSGQSPVILNGSPEDDDDDEPLFMG
ncbi:MAG: hypothetical protein WBG71_07725 [Leeuwenhoekiella sp.]